MKQIDDQAYKDGGAAFAKGKTLRQMIEPIIAKENEPDVDWIAEENKLNSTMLGFADALLAKLRIR